MSEIPDLGEPVTPGSDTVAGRDSDAFPADALTTDFEAQRGRLRGVAYRILGSTADADDAVQEAWLRLHRSDPTTVANLEAFLTTVVARISLDMLRARRVRPVVVPDSDLPEAPPGVDDPNTRDPAESAAVADAVGIALLTVLETLTPGERVAFVLHDLFDLPFEEIAPVVGRSPAAARQLASRARRRVRGAASSTPGQQDRIRRRRVVEAFLAASQRGDFAGLLAVLDPEVVLRADPAAVAMGAPAGLRGADAVASQFAGRAQAARLAVLDGEAGLIWMRGPEPVVAFRFVVALEAGPETGPDPSRPGGPDPSRPGGPDGTGRLTAIEMIADTERLAALEWEFG